MPVIARHQRMRGLALANEIRTRRAQLKKDLKAGRVLLADALLSQEDWFQTMRVREILCAVPGIGETEARRAMSCCLLGYSVQLGTLTAERRRELLKALIERSPSLVLAPALEQNNNSTHRVGEGKTR
jgi:hypothetical protein